MSETCDEVVSDILSGRTFVLVWSCAHEVPGLRVCPLGVVNMPTKASSTTCFSWGWGRRVSTKIRISPLCRRVYWDMSGVVLCCVQSTCGRNLGGTRVGVVSKVGVNQAFRRVPIDRARPPGFRHVVGNLLFEDVRSQFRWENSPGVRKLLAHTLEHCLPHTAFFDAYVSEHARRATQSCRVAKSRTIGAMPLFRDCTDLNEWGAHKHDLSVCTRCYMHVGIFVEVSVSIRWLPVFRCNWEL